MKDISDEFLRRFDYFNDAVIEKITIDYTADPGSRITVIVNCEDDNDPGHGWKHCVVDFQGVAEFKIEQALKTTHSVISFGIAVVHQAGLIYLDFACAGFHERTIDEVRSGDFYVGARKVSVSVLQDAPDGSNSRQMQQWARA